MMFVPLAARLVMPEVVASRSPRPAMNSTPEMAEHLAASLWISARTVLDHVLVP